MSRSQGSRGVIVELQWGVFWKKFLDFRVGEWLFFNEKSFFLLDSCLLKVKEVNNICIFYVYIRYYLNICCCIVFKFVLQLFGKFFRKRNLGRGLVVYMF